MCVADKYLSLLLRLCVIGGELMIEGMQRNLWLSPIQTPSKLIC